MHLISAPRNPLILLTSIRGAKILQTGFAGAPVCLNYARATRRLTLSLVFLIAAPHPLASALP